MPVESDEFHRWMQVLRDDIAGVSGRLDVLNGRTRDAEQKIAVLESQTPDDGSTKAAAWGGGMASVIMGLGEALRWLMGK